MRFHAQTAGCSLTAQQPEINIVRTTIQALAAVLGGTQSLHTNSMDEALALPSEKAVTIALRTQQVIAEESGVTNTVDPLGGSYFVEALTDRDGARGLEYFRRIDDLGGVIPAIATASCSGRSPRRAFRYQQEIDAGRAVIVGVNDYVADEPLEIPILEMDREGDERQVARLGRVAAREPRAGAAHPGRAARTALGETNLMPPLIDCVRAYATLRRDAAMCSARCSGSTRRRWWCDRASSY